jgi:hypothetical protein
MWYFSTRTLYLVKVQDVFVYCLGWEGMGISLGDIEAEMAGMFLDPLRRNSFFQEIRDVGMP